MLPPAALLRRGGALQGSCRRIHLEAQAAHAVSFSDPLSFPDGWRAPCFKRSNSVRMQGSGARGAGFHRWIGEDLELRIHAAPGAKATQVQGLHGESLRVRVCARPVEGAANSALIEFLAAELQVPRTRCVLVSGERSREKRVVVERPPRERTEQLLLAWSQGRTSS